MRVRGSCETWGIQYDWGYTLDGVVLGSPLDHDLDLDAS